MFRDLKMVRNSLNHLVDVPGRGLEEVPEIDLCIVDFIERLHLYLHCTLVIGRNALDPHKILALEPARDLVRIIP